MLNRWLGIASITAMLGANTALVIRDIVPTWTAGDPPRSSLYSLVGDDDFGQKLGIYDNDGQHVGDSWTLARRSGEVLTVYTWTNFESGYIGAAALATPILIRSKITFDARQRPDALQIVVRGLGETMQLDGQLVEPNDFTCRWKIGEAEGDFILPADMLRVFSEVTRPFDHMANLRVGQSWRMHIFNPLSALMPGTNARNMGGEMIVAEVTGQENLFHRGENIRVFIVETDRARAWVAPDGRVVQQQIELPILGRLVLIDEPYDDVARRAHVNEAGF